MKLKQDGIKYFAESILKPQIFQLHQRSDEDRYLHAIAFIAHQYFRLQDNLVDVLLSVVRTFQNTAQRKYTDLCYEQRKTQQKHLSSFLSRLDEDVFGLLKGIRALSQDKDVSDAEKVKAIRLLLDENKCEELESVKSEIEVEMTPAEYYNILESRSVKRQNRVSPIIKALDFGVSSRSGKYRTLRIYFLFKGRYSPSLSAALQM